MRILRPATLGVALALGATGAYAQNVIRQIDNEPVETTIIRGPSGTVITRRPLSPAVAPVSPVATEAVRVGTAAYMDETLGVAPATRTIRTTRSVTRVEHARRATRETVGEASVRTTREAPRRVVHTRTLTHTVRRVAASPPLVLAPAERRVIYRTIVQRQVVPAVAPVPAPPPGYPPYPAPAYSHRSVVVAPAAPAVTTGYAVTTPAADYDDYDDVYAEAVPPAPVPVGYAVGARLPADTMLTPLPANAAVAVPAARPYSYVTIDSRVLLVDPVTNTVVADITP